MAVEGTADGPVQLQAVIGRRRLERGLPVLQTQLWRRTCVPGIVSIRIGHLSAALRSAAHSLVCCPGCSWSPSWRLSCLPSGTARTGPPRIRSTANRGTPEIILQQTGNPTSRQPVVEVISHHTDGDSFVARVHQREGRVISSRGNSLRGIDAPELKASCQEELNKAEAAS